MKKNKSTEIVIVTGTLNFMGCLLLVLILFYYLLEHIGLESPDQLYKPIMACAILYIPTIILSSYGSFIKIYSRKIYFGLPFVDYISITWKATLWGAIGIFFEVGLFACIDHFKQDNILSAIVMILVLSLSLIALVILMKSLVHDMTDPNRLQIDISAQMSKKLFHASNATSVFALLLVSMLCFGLFFIGWKKQYVIGGLSIASMVPLLLYFRYRVRRVIKECNLPESISC